VKVFPHKSKYILRILAPSHKMVDMAHLTQVLVSKTTLVQILLMSLLESHKITNQVDCASHSVMIGAKLHISLKMA